MKNYLIIFSLISSFCFGSCADPTGPLDPICETFNFPEPPCCGASGLAARIRGPVEPVNTTAGDFPWWVSVSAVPRGRAGLLTCLGALINTQWVITAAHCVMKYETAQRIYVSVNGLPRIIVDKFALHPFYERKLNAKGGFDSALLHLIEPVSYSSIRLPICLPLDPALKHRNFKDANVTVVGWGKFGRAKAQAKVVGKSKLVIRVPKYTGTGDSGGPMIIELDDNPKKIKAYYVLANNSAGGHKLAIMVKVIDRIEWIKATIQYHDDDNPYAVGRNPIKSSKAY